MTPSAATATRHPQARVSSRRLRLHDGATTTLHVARYDRRTTTIEVAALTAPAPLAEWCRRQNVGEAVIGGFFIRPQGTPLGELRIAGSLRPSVPFDAPWHAVRTCVHVSGGEVAIAPRGELPADPPGDLLQAGPLLTRAGRATIDGDGAHDIEGFSAGSRQFDSDITVGRYPRSALGISATELIAAVCDGRGEHDAGLTLAEMAGAMVDLGAADAVNLDGGGSASIVSGGRLLNTPREEHGAEIAGGREISTALAFLSRN